ncbi:hypothetical protein EMIHUDRAFT_437868 [Emiliania huxleyi CCMP1516]|uniref:Secreted protein n=2 Tax=Emiliania huxleyi TaxID=2903 RepID=A0A0D3IGS2_EMIH1|nr:hypothetical protein EMIHUDRAFT_437868 [Emiliania huxleyi CCMP1516]EOD10457.1 hypothetical protein EMIHUDRAFT_437868 [Emiliania huxleyi CCMP1516]|eukprot:XP_005762886.1 hypothetical protein EMIHUDRAFT_437868 [Emiliania huxleyi CCMP1516]
MLARIGLLQLSLPAVVGFAPNPSVSVDDLCEALATYANDGCGMDTTGKDKRACVVELSVFSGSDGALSTDEAVAALDTIPDAVLTAIEAVDVGATCKREHLQSSGSDLLDMFLYRANWRLLVGDSARRGCASACACFGMCLHEITAPKREYIPAEARIPATARGAGMGSV